MAWWTRCEVASPDEKILLVFWIIEIMPEEQTQRNDKFCNCRSRCLTPGLDNEEVIFIFLDRCRPLMFFRPLLLSSDNDPVVTTFLYLSRIGGTLLRFFFLLRAVVSSNLLGQFCLKWFKIVVVTSHKKCQFFWGCSCFTCCNLLTIWLRLFLIFLFIYLLV